MADTNREMVVTIDQESDVASRMSSITRSITDNSITVSDLITGGMADTNRIIHEMVVTIDDRISALQKYTRIISNTVITSDTASRMSSITRSITELPITVSDRIARTIGISGEIISETVAVMDTVNRKLRAKRSIAERRILLSDFVFASIPSLIIRTISYIRDVIGTESGTSQTGVSTTSYIDPEQK